MHLRRLLSYPELLTQKFLDLRSVTFSGNLLRLRLLFLGTNFQELGKYA